MSQSHQWSGCFNASEKFTENNWEELTQINQAQATKHKSTKLKQLNATNKHQSVRRKNPVTSKIPIGHKIGLNGHILCFEELSVRFLVYGLNIARGEA